MVVTLTCDVSINSSPSDILADKLRIARDHWELIRSQSISLATKVETTAMKVLVENERSKKTEKALIESYVYRNLHEDSR